MTQAPSTALFLDIGGVLLTNGWDRTARRRAADTFGLDYEEMDERHHLTFDTYERGFLTLDEYLRRVVFIQEQSFTRQDFKAFMFAQSKPYPDMIDFIRALRARGDLRIVAVSNEGRELTVHRIREFNLAALMDAFICSSFVGHRKPDVEIYRMALDVCQVPPEHAIYVDDRPMFVEVARDLGIRGVHHTSLESTRAKLSDFGLRPRDE